MQSVIFLLDSLWPTPNDTAKQIKVDGLNGGKLAGNEEEVMTKSYALSKASNYKKKTIGGKGGEAKKPSGINICTIRKQQYVNTVA